MKLPYLMTSSSAFQLLRLSGENHRDGCAGYSRQTLASTASMSLRMRSYLPPDTPRANTPGVVLLARFPRPLHTLDFSITPAGFNTPREAWIIDIESSTVTACAPLFFACQSRYVPEPAEYSWAPCGQQMRAVALVATCVPPDHTGVNGTAFRFRSGIASAKLPHADQCSSFVPYI